MGRKKSITSKIGTIIFILIVAFILFQLYEVYKSHYYNGFTKAEYTRRSFKIYKR